MNALIDNDILFKGACYGLLSDLVSTVCAGNSVGILGSARFVLPQRIERTDLKRSPTLALEAFSLFLRQATELEPAADEQRMAADLELAAQRLGVSLDSGESQLCAILALRYLPLLLTGDKRAIIAMERLLDCDSRLAHIAGKVTCLEQLFALLLVRDGNDRLRTTICTEPNIDKALSNCFSCHSHFVPDASHMDGLQSYITALRGLASRILSP